MSRLENADLGEQSIEPEIVTELTQNETWAVDVQCGQADFGAGVTSAQG